MKTLFVIASTFTIEMTSMAQDPAMKKFEKFLESQTQSNGKIQFKTFCVIDTLFVEDAKTGELSDTILQRALNLLRADNFVVKVDHSLLLAPFTTDVVDEAGEKIGEQDLAIKFKQGNGTCEIIGISDASNSTWSMANGCWTRAN